MNILVTGGAGFIGSQMARGISPTAIGSSSWTTSRPDGARRCRRAPVSSQADIAEADLEPLLRGREDRFVSHHAAQIDLRHSVSDPLLDARVEHPRVAEALRGVPARRDRAASCSPRPEAPCTASPRAAGRRRRTTRPIPCPPTGARSSRSRSTSTTTASSTDSKLGLPICQRLRPGPERTGRGGRRRDLLPRRSSRAGAPKIRGDGGQTRDYVFVGGPREARRARPRAQTDRAAPGTSARASRRRSTGSSSSSRGQLDYRDDARASAAAPRRAAPQRSGRSSPSAASSICRPGRRSRRGWPRPRSGSGSASRAACGAVGAALPAGRGQRARSPTTRSAAS